MSRVRNVATSEPLNHECPAPGAEHDYACGHPDRICPWHPMTQVCPIHESDILAHRPYRRIDPVAFVPPPRRAVQLSLPE